jgi:S-DNA-T family DNA segregation ATPase FtsK/SpoIIIE
LIGRGDMLLATGSDLIRLQCAFVSTNEVEEITDYIGAQQAYPQAFQLPEYVEEGSEDGNVEFSANEKDALFDQCARIVVETQQGSASLLQRRLKIGYNRAGRIIDQLQAAGIIGAFEGSKAREVMIKDFMQLDEKLKALSSSSEPQM